MWGWNMWWLSCCAGWAPSWIARRGSCCHRLIQCPSCRRGKKKLFLSSEGEGFETERLFLLCFLDAFEVIIHFLPSKVQHHGIKAWCCTGYLPHPFAEFTAVLEFSSWRFVEYLAHGSPVLVEAYRLQCINNLNAVLPLLCYVFCTMELPS